MGAAIASTIAFLALGCAHARVDAALEQRVPGFAPQYGPGGSVRFLEFWVDDLAPPSFEESPHPHAEGLIERDLRYRFVLHTNEAVFPVTCTVEGSAGSLGIQAQSAILCDSERFHVAAGGTGSSDFFRATRVHGETEGPSDVTHPPEGSPPEVGSVSLAIEGSGRLWNLTRRLTTWRYLEGRWTSDCCEEGYTVAAVTLDPPRVIFDPSLSSDLRIEAAMAIAALLVLRGVEELDPVGLPQ